MAKEVSDGDGNGNCGREIRLGFTDDMPAANSACPNTTTLPGRVAILAEQERCSLLIVVSTSVVHRTQFCGLKATMEDGDP